jgi:predicted membrane channel-forming protein YqfA (hemolysin III family)
VKLFFMIVVWIAGAIVLFVVWLDVDDATMRWIMLSVLMIWVVVVPAWQQYTRRGATFTWSGWKKKRGPRDGQ